LLCALLRERGTPARARCGFGAYFEPGRFVDHWVCEVWDAERDSWRLVDAQLDARTPLASGFATCGDSGSCAANLARDVASLSKRELLPWDVWGMMAGPEAVETADELALLDCAAELTRSGDAAYAELRKLHDEPPGFRVPRNIFSAVQQTPVDLGADFS